MCLSSGLRDRRARARATNNRAMQNGAGSNGRRVRQGLFRFILVKGRLRRLCTSNLVFDHSRSGNVTRRHTRRHTPGRREILRRTKVTRGTRARRVHGYCRLGGEGELRRPGVEGRQRVRQTGATAYFLICDAGVPAPLLEVCDVSVIRFARPTG